MDLLGVTRTIDHAVYIALNALAIILWRLDSALLGISLLSYRTQDWLTGPDGGVWRLLARLVGAEGIFGLATWQVFLTLALVLFGLSRIIRPFLRTRSVDLGRLLFFAAMAYVFISQGSEMMRQAETWRSQAGSYVYNALATGEPVDLDIPGGTTGDLIYSPQDLDGEIPIRGWEAVATSYFLATNADQLHAGVPPRDFRLAYCLYDPARPIDEQDEENAEGCSPRLAWDEWDLVSTQTITQVWGIPLPIDISLTLPIVEEHPENRQLGIRQAQAGVARLALGPVVSLFPIVEANVGLMLSLAASFLYLSLPITLLFGFFLYTEPMATRLFLQFISVFLRTLILNGLIALFMVVLMGVAADGSLMAYLGLVGVGLAGGVFLMKIAGDTMKETLSQSLGAMGGIWMGATTGVLGEGARRPAQAALGAAKLGAIGATLAAGGLGAPGVMAPAFDVARSGTQDLRGKPPDQAEAGVKRPGRLPDPLARVVARDQAMDGSLRPVAEAEPAVPLPAQWSPDVRRPPAAPSSRQGEPVPWTSPVPSDVSRRQPPEGPAPATGRAVEAWTEEVYRARERGQGQRQVGEAGRELLGEGLAREAERAMARHSQEETMAVLRAVRQAAAEARTRGEAGTFFRADGSLAPEGVKAVRERLDEKTARAFSGQQGERDLAALAVAGMKPRKLPGESLAREAEQAMARHSQEETTAVLRAARQAAAEARTRGGAEAFFRADGSLAPEGVKAVRERLDEKTARAFSGKQGERDLAVLTAAGMNPRREASPEAFRRATAEAQGWRGEAAAGRTVPRALGLDPAAAEEHFASLNRFARLSEQAGLTPKQRQQLLKEVQQEGKVSANLRLEIEASLRRQKDKAAGLKVDDVVASAQALPKTLRGPVAVRLPGGQMRKRASAGRPETKSPSASAVRKPVGEEKKRSERGGAA